MPVRGVAGRSGLETVCKKLKYLRFGSNIREMADSNSRGNGGGGNAARFLGLSFTLALILGVPIVVGFVLDRVAGTLPLFLLLGVALGFVGSLYYVYRAIKSLGG